MAAGRSAIVPDNEENVESYIEWANKPLPFLQILTEENIFGYLLLHLELVKLTVPPPNCSKLLQCLVITMIMKSASTMLATQIW